jgi:hypothetical protein
VEVTEVLSPDLKMQLAKRIGMEMGVYDPKAVEDNYRPAVRTSLLGEVFSVKDQGVAKAAQWFEQKAQENRRASSVRPTPRR